MNCRLANRLLPLWIGQDLADASEADALQAHLVQCQDCSEQGRQLQEALDALQSISTTSLPAESGSHSRLWPRLAMVLKEVPRRRDQFNGWIPAVAMAMAASLMVAVSVVQIRREMGNTVRTNWYQDSSTSVDRNLFETDRRFKERAGLDRDVPVPGLVVSPADRQTPSF
jgi:hypothetical protein